MNRRGRGIEPTAGHRAWAEGRGCHPWEIANPSRSPPPLCLPVAQAAAAAVVTSLVKNAPARRARRTRSLRRGLHLHRRCKRHQAEEVAQVLQPSGTHVWEALRRHWGRTFCIRLDLQGYFHTYPDVGGPFQSLQETDKAIDHYLECSRDPKMKMCMEKDGKFSMERAVRQALYWPDGTIKKRKRSYSTDKSRNRIFLFAQALVDKYNEDNNLLKDAAHGLKDVLHHQQICEKQIWYYHLNFTTKIKGSGPDNFSEDNLFFAEIKCIPHREHPELLVSCCCPINLNDNGQHCYGCTNHGNVDMKHPDSSDEFAAGHLDVHLPVGSFVESSDYDSDDDKYVKAREAKLRRM